MMSRARKPSRSARQHETVSNDSYNDEVEPMLASQKVVHVFCVVHTAVELAALASIINSDLESTFAIHKGTLNAVKGSSLTHTALLRPVHLENRKSGCTAGSMCLAEERETRSLGNSPITCEDCWRRAHEA